MKHLAIIIFLLLTANTTLGKTIIKVETNHKTIKEALTAAKKVLLQEKFITLGEIQETTFTAKRTTVSHADYYIADVTALENDSTITLTIIFLNVGKGFLNLDKLGSRVKTSLIKNNFNRNVNNSVTIELSVKGKDINESLLAVKKSLLSEKFVIYYGFQNYEFTAKRTSNSASDYSIADVHIVQKDSFSLISITFVNVGTGFLNLDKVAERVKKELIIRMNTNLSMKSRISIEVKTDYNTVTECLKAAKSVLLKEKFMILEGIQKTSFTSIRTTVSSADYYIADVLVKEINDSMLVTIDFENIGSGFLNLEKVADRVKRSLDPKTNSEYLLKNSTLVKVQTNHETIREAIMTVKSALLFERFITYESVNNGSFTSKRTTASNADYYIADVNVEKTNDSMTISVTLISIGSGFLNLDKVAERVKYYLKYNTENKSSLKKQLTIELPVKNKSIKEALILTKNTLLDEKFIVSGSFKDSSFITKRTTGSKADYYIADVVVFEKNGNSYIKVSFISIGEGLLNLEKVALKVKTNFVLN